VRELPVAEGLTEKIAALAGDAAARATSPGAAAALAEVRERLDGPIRLAIAGKVKAGKSTLLNALIGEELAPTDAGECTRILTWYRYADRPYALLHPKDGEPVERPFSRHGALEVDLGGRDPDHIDHLEVGWPTRRLQDLVLIDTPGIASLSTHVSARTHESMSADAGRTPIADAVLYLLRHTHATDLRFLEAFHDDEVAQGTPVNTVGVLSRADEIGAARLDAMEVADRVARRYESEPRLHRLCPVVVPVNGLLGHAAATLREAEYAALRAIAAAPEDTVAELLLTADRFATLPGTVEVSPGARTALLDRLGLFGVRLSVELLRTGAVATSSELAARLADSSGLGRLRAVVLVQFQTRARILKARSAVAALHDLLHRGACRDPEDLLGRLEQVTAGAHEFEEIRILLELREGELSLPPGRAQELDRLMGGSGHDRATRLGLRPGASIEEERRAMLDALGTWQAVSRHPLSSRSLQIAARAATRTLEGFLSQELR
jgi:hypothetical protein